MFLQKNILIYIGSEICNWKTFNSSSSKIFKNKIFSCSFFLLKIKNLKINTMDNYQCGNGLTHIGKKNLG